MIGYSTKNGGISLAQLQSTRLKISITNSRSVQTDGWTRIEGYEVHSMSTFIVLLVEMYRSLVLTMWTQLWSWSVVTTTVTTCSNPFALPDHQTCVETQKILTASMECMFKSQRLVTQKPEVRFGRSCSGHRFYSLLILVGFYQYSHI